MKQFALGVVVSLIIFALVVASYFFGKQSNDPKPSPSPTSAVMEELPVLPTPVPDTIQATPEPTPDPASIISNAVSNKTYTDLQGMMAESVTVRIEASGCCQPQNPAGAVAQLKYLDNAKAPWLFDPTNATILQLAAKSPDYWGPEKVVGITEDKFAVSFGVDAAGKINTISMAASYDLILNQ